MSTEPAKPLKLFYCYAREDKELRDELDLHLKPLQRQNLITSWSDREISPGADWKKEIDIQLNAAHLILLLVTPHFMASDYCYSIEMERALERHHAGTARVIPLILRHADWEDTPFSALQVLPTDAKPIKQWHDRDEAFRSITNGIRKAINELRLSLKTKEEWGNEGLALTELKCYDDAISTHDHAIRLSPNSTSGWNNEGLVLYGLKRYDDAIAAFDQTIRLDPNVAYSWNNKGLALHNLKRYDDAIAAYDHALRLDPNYAYAWNNKGYALADLRRYDDAIAAYDHAIRLDPNHALPGNKGNALHNLKRYDDAIAAYDHAIRLDPNYAYAWNNKGCCSSQPQTL